MKYSHCTFFILILTLSLGSNVSIVFAETKNSTKTAENCNNLRLQILGEGGPEINDGLASSSYVIWIKDKARILVDAGGGSSLNFEKSGAKFNDLQAILLTHLHVDHSAALPVYLKAGYFSDRQIPLPVFGPSAGGNFPSTEDFLAAFLSDKHISVYPYLSDNLYQQPSTDFLVQPQSIKATNKIWKKEINRDVRISAISVNHGAIPALAWRIDSGLCSITFSGDMNGSSGNLPKLATKTNILVAHNAIPQQTSIVAKRLHMTPTKIGEIAAQAFVKKLVLSHFMLRTMNKKLQSKQLIQKNYHGLIIEAKSFLYILP